jgi:transcriptional regulator with XRE-family HTH domain
MPAARDEAERDGATLAIDPGRRIREARRRRRLYQASLAARVGIGQARLGGIERGRGEGVPLALWIALGAALEMPFRAAFDRDRQERVVDASHLAIQELVLRLARANGTSRSLELPTRPAQPAHSVDVLICDDRHRQLRIIEAWNHLGDVGGAARSTSRKVAEAEPLAVVAGGDGEPYAVVACWVLRDTRHHRDLLRRYPEVFATRFPGSSRAWAAALTNGTPAPLAAGLVWSDQRATRIFARRR